MGLNIQKILTEKITMATTYVTDANTGSAELTISDGDMETGTIETDRSDSTIIPNEDEIDEQLRSIADSNQDLAGYTNTAEETYQEMAKQAEARDWRVRISLAPSADYLYKDQSIAEDPTALLYPLIGTRGVIFPYVPSISVAYTANYESIDLTHTNYKFYQYRGSEVGQISITAEFTAQDIYEAKYMLAMMQFFKSVTKMFYGQDKNRGVPPPVCYLSGFGKLNFDNHPILITSFGFQYPPDCDYIRVASNYTETSYFGYTADSTNSSRRLTSSGLQFGGGFNPPKFTKTYESSDTYVPTKLQVTISAYPLVSRYDMANNFSLENYAKGTITNTFGGTW
jgi:hypothetical protein